MRRYRAITVFVELRQEEELLEGMKAQFARIPSPVKGRRYSPFAMCAVGEFEVMEFTESRAIAQTPPPGLARSSHSTAFSTQSS